MLWGYLKGQGEPYSFKSKLQISPDNFDNISKVTLPKLTVIFFFEVKKYRCKLSVTLLLSPILVTQALNKL